MTPLVLFCQCAHPRLRFRRFTSPSAAVTSANPFTNATSTANPSDSSYSFITAAATTTTTPSSSSSSFHLVLREFPRELEHATVGLNEYHGHAPQPQPITVLQHQVALTVPRRQLQLLQGKRN